MSSSCEIELSCQAVTAHLTTFSLCILKHVFMQQPSQLNLHTVKVNNAHTTRMTAVDGLLQTGIVIIPFLMYAVLLKFQGKELLTLQIEVLMLQVLQQLSKRTKHIHTYIHNNAC